MNSLAVRVLGEFGVDGVEPQALGSRKARLALRLLALGEGQAVPSAVLADALWGDAPPARPEDQLAVLMSRLRAVLGRDRISYRDGGYLLHCDWLDAAELATLTEETGRRRAAGNTVGAAAAARVALSLAAGPGPAPVPGEWAELRVAGLERLAARARRTAATALLEAGDWVAASEAAAQALERDPYDEEALRVLLRAYVSGGRVAAALSAYAGARERLAAELGTDPSPETAALFTAILRGELSPPAPVPASAAPGLVGRDDELACLDAIAARARGDAVEVAVVDGEAGIGKTTLLRAWAGRRAAAGDTVLMASCGRLDRAMPLDAVLGAFAVLLRRLGPEEAADLLGPDAALLGPLLGVPGPQPGAPGVPPGPVDGVLGPGVVYAALLRVLGRLGDRGPVVVVIDDAHLAGPALADWVRYARRGSNAPGASGGSESSGPSGSGGIPREGGVLPRVGTRDGAGPLAAQAPSAPSGGYGGSLPRVGRALALVLAVRRGEGEPLPATAVVHLDVLDREAAAELVGPARVEELYLRSQGHPLFLTELAQQVAGAELPATLVESVSARCDELGTAGALLRAAAVLGPELDIDLLAALLGRPAVELLDDAERAAAGLLLTGHDGTFAFRHELVREALAATATSGRAALLHRQAGRMLARRTDADPLTVAHHARLGGDVELASQALRGAAARAAERFDHGAAEDLLDDSLRLHPDPDGWLARARVRVRRGRYAGALADAELAAAAGPSAAGPSAPGPAALEVAAWASYFDRRFAAAGQFAEDGALAAPDATTRARCLAVGGRTRHAAGDLARAELLLGEAVSLAAGQERVTAAAWLGVLRAHQSRVDEALALLRPAARGQVGVEHTAATLHALLFTGHAHALAGRPALALDSFARHTAEAARRQVPRFAGRAVNFTGWVLRNIGAAAEGLDRHQEALDAAAREGTAEVTIAVLEDLAEHCLDAGDLDGAQARLAEARALLRGDLVFGWRLDLKHRLISARLALRRGAAEQALDAAGELEARAAGLGIPRYTGAARLLRHRAGRALGLPADPGEVAADLGVVEGAVAIEAWWWTGEVAADFASSQWLDLAAERAARLADHAGGYADGFRAEAARRLDAWRALM